MLIFYISVGICVGTVYGIREAWSVMHECNNSEKAAFTGGMVAVASGCWWPIWLFGHAIGAIGVRGYLKWRSALEAAQDGEKR